MFRPQMCCKCLMILQCHNCFLSAIEMLKQGTIILKSIILCLSPTSKQSKRNNLIKLFSVCNVAYNNSRCFVDLHLWLRNKQEGLSDALSDYMCFALRQTDSNSQNIHKQKVIVSILGEQRDKARLAIHAY